MEFRDCLYFVLDFDESEIEQTIFYCGRCRRFPPVAVVNSELDFDFRWLVTSPFFFKIFLAVDILGYDSVILTLVVMRTLKEITAAMDSAVKISPVVVSLCPLLFILASIPLQASTRLQACMVHHDFCFPAVTPHLIKPE
jgi:hypothetical protein